MEVRTFTNDELKASSPEMLTELKKFSQATEKKGADFMFVVAFDAGQPIGVATLFCGQGCSNLHIDFLDVEKDHRKQGVATRLLESVFNLAREKGRQISYDGFTRDGQGYLAHIIDRLGRQEGNDSHAMINRF